MVLILVLVDVAVLDNSLPYDIATIIVVSILVLVDVAVLGKHRLRV